MNDPQVKHRRIELVGVLSVDAYSFDLIAYLPREDPRSPTEIRNKVTFINFSA
jgi:hypothetical protein